MISDLNDEIEILGKVFHFRTHLLDRLGLTVRSVVLLDYKVVATREMCFDRREQQDEETARAWMQEQHKRVFERFAARVLDYERRKASPGERPRLVTEPSLPRSSELVPTAAGGAGSTADPPSATATETLVRSLRVRRCFAGFSKLVGDSSALQPDEVDQRLTAASEAFDWMIQSADFAEIRIDEQVRCHLLKDEVDEWLAGGGAPEQGTRVWSDVLTFKNYMAEVNYRSELVAFDREMLVWVLGHVRRSGMTEEVREHLAWLYGLFPQLNRLLDHPVGVSDDAWVGLLRNALTLTDPRCGDADDG